MLRPVELDLLATNDATTYEVGAWSFAPPPTTVLKVLKAGFYRVIGGAEVTKIGAALASRVWMVLSINVAHATSADDRYMRRHTTFEGFNYPPAAAFPTWQPYMEGILNVPTDADGPVEFEMDFAHNAAVNLDFDPWLILTRLGDPISGALEPLP